MSKALIFCFLILSLTGCQSAETKSSRETVGQVRASSQPSPAPVEVDLSKIGRIAPKGRVQDRDYNQLEVVEELTKHGKDSIPFLIGKLEDETKTEGRVIDYWSETSVGDVAFIILCDFFTDSSWQRTTIPGMDWLKFLGNEKDSSLTGEQRLRKYIAKHGRAGLKAKWQSIWDEYKDRIYWDAGERCFKVAAS